MFRNYCTIALRNFWRHKVFSLITLSGLAIGISTSLVIYLIVQYNLSFNTSHPESRHIYRVVTDFRFSGEEYHNSGVPVPLAKAIKDEVTGVAETMGFLIYVANVEIPQTGKAERVLFKNERSTMFVDGAFFRFFPRQWLAGSQSSALEQPFQVVISKSKAKRYFPKTEFADIIGKRIIYNDSIQATVSGVVEDAPANTDFTFDDFISYATVQATGLKNSYGLETWGNTNSAAQLYVKLAPRTAPEQVHGQLKRLMRKYWPDDNKDSKNTADWSLQPLHDLHFNGNYNTYLVPVQSRTGLYGLAAAALFLLLLGCINFINLTTAQSMQRAKEIGIRKTIGSSRKQLIFQFLSETFLITSFATGTSVVLMPWILKAFADFIPLGLRFNPFQEPHILLFLFILTVVVTLLSGCYPAYVLSGYNPVQVLKNQVFATKGTSRTAWLRKTLTVSQFVIAQVFIMATVLVTKQIHYSLTKEMGFKKTALLSFDIPFLFQPLIQQQPETKHSFLAEKLRAMPEIEAVSIGGPPPASNTTFSGQLTYVDGKKQLETDVQLKYGDTTYLKVYGLRLLAGCNVRQSDSTIEYIINETYSKMLGFRNPEEAIGKNLIVDNKHIPIVGVIADFHQRSLHEAIKPLALSCATRNNYTFHVALKQQAPGSNAWNTGLQKIEEQYKQLYPKDGFQYAFYDESIAAFYKADQDTSKLLGWATGLSILISCLGLLGLAIYTTNQRTKEIGIRKVLGATVAQIVTILSKEFVLLVLIAFVIAVPVAWWGMKQWLQNFAYRTDVSWWIFGVSGSGMLLMALLVLSARTIKAAHANPVKNLRTE